MNKNKIFKLSSVLILATTGLVSAGAFAQEVALREQVGIVGGVKAGILGLGAELAVPLNNQATVRANFSYLPALNLEVKNEYIAGSAKLSNLNIMGLVDWHPFNNAFMISFGLTYNNLGAGINGQANVTKILNAAKEDVAIKTAKDAAEKLNIELAKKVEKTLQDIDAIFTKDTAEKDRILTADASTGLASNFGGAFMVGADNSNDPEASFVYGFDIGVMFVQPAFKTVSYNFSGLKFTDTQTESLKKSLKDSQETLTQYIEAKGGSVTSNFIANLDVTKAVAVASKGTSSSDDASSTGGILSGLLSNWTPIPVMSAKIAVPIQ